MLRDIRRKKEERENAEREEVKRLGELGKTHNFFNGRSTKS